jgi:hypothetical protein
MEEEFEDTQEQVWINMRVDDIDINGKLNSR